MLFPNIEIGGNPFSTQINPDALSTAQDLDYELANGTLRGPSHGIPIFIKNNMTTIEKMNYTAGSYSLLDATAPRDSCILLPPSCVLWEILYWESPTFLNGFAFAYEQRTHIRDKVKAIRSSKCAVG